MADNTKTTNAYFVNDVANNKSQYASNYKDTNSTIGSMFIPNMSTENFVFNRQNFLDGGLAFENAHNASNDIVHASFNDPGNYFFKVFFNFKTHYGLFGGTINDTETPTDISKETGPKEYNTASMYLQNNMLSPRFDKYYRNILKQKQKSLIKFASILYYITLNCPWFFKEIGGLEEILQTNFLEIAKKENSQITINFNQDAVDMRVSTLIDLYKHACFDYTNHREVIPENLRKFDMSILIFNPPTYTITKEGKTLIPESYKCIILKNCEINKTGLKSVNDVLNNELGFQHNLSLGITYERSYIYSLNKSWNVEILDLLYNADEVAADQIVGRTTSATEDAGAAINQTEVEDNTQEPTPEPTPEPTQADYENYLIKKGDTLSEIVAKFKKSKNPKLTIKMVQDANPTIIKNVDKIYAGDTIKIPLK